MATSTKRKNIPRLLKQWRKRRSKELGRNFTQEEAAKAAGLSPGTYIEYEQGRRGKNMNDVTYQHILTVTGSNGAVSATSDAPPVSTTEAAGARV